MASSTHSPFPFPPSSDALLPHISPYWVVRVKLPHVTPFQAPYCLSCIEFPGLPSSPTLSFFSPNTIPFSATIDAGEG